MKEIVVKTQEGHDPMVAFLMGLRDLVGVDLRLALVVRVGESQEEMVTRVLRAAEREFYVLGGQPEVKADLFVAPSKVLPGEQQFHDAVQDAVDTVVTAAPAAPIAGRKVEALREKRQAEKTAKKAAPKKRAPGTKGAGSRTPAVLEERNCEACQKPYLPRRKDQKYCYDPECRKDREKAYMQSWSERNRAALETHREDPAAVAIEELRGVPEAELERVVVPESPLEENDAEVQAFEEMLREEEELDPALMAVDFGDLDPEELLALEDDADETITWTLCANGERFTDDALKIVLAGKVLLPGTLLRKRGGRFYTVTGMHELKPIHLTAEISNGFVDRSRYNHNGFKAINERLGGEISSGNAGYRYGPQGRKTPAASNSEVSVSTETVE